MIVINRLSLFEAIFILSIFVFYGCASLKPSLSNDDFLELKMEKARVVGLQSAVIANGTIRNISSKGLKRFDLKDPINDSTLFLIASSSKPITALSCLKLIEEYDIQLDSDINDHLSFKIFNPYYPSEKISIRNLLTHTSSIIDNWEVLDSLYTLPKGGDSAVELKDYIKSTLVATGRFYEKDKSFKNEKPSTYWEYSNTGYALLGLVIEEVSGQSFSEYCYENVLKPLKMHNTFWFLKDIPHDNITNPHEILENNGHKALNHYGYPTYPDGQLRTTVSDYAKFISMILNDGKIGTDRFLSSDMIDEFLKIQFPEINKWQAIAWNYNEFENFIFYLNIPHSPAHTGGDPGVTTAVFFDKNKKGAVILFLNTRLNDFKGVKAMYLDVLKRLAKEANII